jgi:drug/metabolite transporter (DMT)-like permease
MTALRAAWAWFFRRPYVVLGVTATMWAGNAIAGRLAVGEISPMALTGLRWLIALAALAAIAGRQIRAEAPALKPRWRYVLLMGALGYTAFNALFYISAHHTTAVNMAIIQGSMPVLVLLGALAAFGTRIRGTQVVGMAVTLVGVALVATQGDLTTVMRVAFNVGDLWMICACVFYAGYTVFLRNRPDVSGITLFAVLAAVAFLTSLPLVAYEIAAGTVQWPTPKGWLIMLFIGLFPSFLAQVFFMRAVELIGPGRAGLFVNLVPVFGAFLAVLILGEPFHLYHAAALALVLGGIIIAERVRAR